MRVATFRLCLPEHLRSFLEVGLALMLACLLAVCSSASAVEIYDSGWSVSGSHSQRAQVGAAVLKSRQVPISELLPRRAIDQLIIPPRPPKSKSVKQAKPNNNAARVVRPKEKSPASADDQKSPTESAKVEAQGPELEWLPTRPQRLAARPKAGAGDEAKPANPKKSADVSDAFSIPGAKIEAAPSEESAGPQIASPQRSEAPIQQPAKTPQPKPESLRKALPSETKIKTEPASQPNVAEEPSLREPAPFPGIGKPAPVSKPVERPQSKTPAKQPATAPAKEPTTKQEPKVEPRRKTVKTEPTKLPQRSQPPASEPTRKRASVNTSVSPKSILYPSPASTAALKPLSRNQQYLRRRLRSVLSYYYRRPLNTMQHDPWEVMHGMLPYGLHSRVLDGSPRGKPVTAIGHLCFNKDCKRKRLMHLNAEGELDADVAYGLQGHKGQFLAMLAQCNVSPEYPIRVEGQKFTIGDLIRAEQRTCYTKSELTFKLIGLMHYLPSDASWVNDQGETWDFPRLVNEERNQKIRGAACGGTHRLSGLALAMRTRELRGEPLDGEYLEARRFVEKYQQYAFRLQNSDGSLSTEWFRGPGAEEDINRRVRTTGHLLEWLLYSLPDEEVTGYRTVRAVNYLTSLLASNTSNPWEVGPLAHALHALMLYDQRVFQPHDNPVQLADNDGGKASTNRSATQQSPNYRTITSRVYGSYPSSKEAEALREEIAERDSGGLRGIFGFGNKSTRRSRR